jgi:hypothetical protein
MKKVILSMIALLAFGYAHAQKDMAFGIRGGLDMVSVKVASVTVPDGLGGTETFGGGTVSTTGFYLGGFADISISDKIMLEPGLCYHTASKDGAKYDFLSIPVTFKYQVADKINVLAGPTMFYSMDSDDPDKTRFNLDLGGSYDISDKFFIDPRYSIGLTGDSKVNHFLIGVGYKF